MQNNEKNDIELLYKKADDVRDQIIKAVEKNGGHLASNLGVVELTVALHSVFNPYFDKILWDVGHQCYAHKILTGRKLDNLRTDYGVTGFPNPLESKADVFTTGHASTALSTAIGLVRARDLQGQKYDVLAIIGDAAFSGGLVYEALNDIIVSQRKLIIVLNDNKMSIEKNNTAMARHFENLQNNNIDNTKNIISNFGIDYIGVINGHDIKVMQEAFFKAKNSDNITFIHVLTNKGNGLDEAKENPVKFHSVERQKIDKNLYKRKDKILFSKFLGDAICDIAKNNLKVVAVTASMKSSIGLNNFFENYKDRAFDVGICEQHAVTMAAGLARGGMKPIVAIYSTFLQRSFDQIVHDVCIDNLPVIFCIDRAGANGEDGKTHQGIFDMAYLSLIPNIKILSPIDGNDLVNILNWAVGENCPIAIRYPKYFYYEYKKSLPNNNYCKWDFYKKCKNPGGIILTVGNRGFDVVKNIKDVDIVCVKCIKPLDTVFLSNIFCKYKKIVTIEDGIKNIGFGSSIIVEANKINYNGNIINIGHDLSFGNTLDIDKMLYAAGFDTDYVRSIFI